MKLTNESRKDRAERLARQLTKLEEEVRRIVQMVEVLKKKIKREL
jgi:hypothetical protein